MSRLSLEPALQQSRSQRVHVLIAADVVLDRHTRVGVAVVRPCHSGTASSAAGGHGHNGRIGRRVKW